MSMGKLLWAGFIAISLAIVWVFVTGDQQSRQAPPRPEQAIAVSVAKIQSKDVERVIEAIGSVKAYESVTISANVTEYVKELFFNDGDYVEKEAPLVELISDEELAQHGSAKARLIEAQANFDRIAKLLRRHHASKAEHDNTYANLQSAKAKLDEIKAKLNDRTIRAPFAGVLGFRLVSEGSLLEPGDKIVTLDMIVPIKVDFTLAERYMGHVSQGLPFKAHSIAYPDHTFKGKITAIASRVDEQTRSVTVRGKIANKDKKLKPGMLLKIFIPQQARRVLLIPESALLARGNERFIFIIENNRAKKIPVKVVERVGDTVHIDAEIAKNTEVVVDGGFKLFENTKVKIKHVSL